MPRQPQKTKNPFLIEGVTRYSRSAAFRKTHSWKKKKSNQWKVVPKKDKTVKPKEKKFGKDGSRVIKKKAPRYYREEDTPHKLYSRKNHHRPTHLRRGIKPGTVLILLAGRFRGSRVVFLKQLKSGLLLINGPFKINGVPLRRVNQAYVIATSTRVDISDVKVDEKINDKYFSQPAKKKENKPAEKKEDAEKKKQAKKEKKDAKTKDASSGKKDKKKKVAADKKKRDPNAPKEKKKKASEGRIADQKAIDALLIPKIKKTPLLKKYLRSKFSLKKGQHPHLLKF
jgi:large subunit ribosomal protein L6e